MDWELAIEKNHGAFKRVLAMLVAMAGMGEPRGSGQADAVAPPSVLSLVEGPDISPTRGEVTLASLARPIANVDGEGPPPLLISPLVGEMSGPSTRLRTEGGNVERSPSEALLISPDATGHIAACNLPDTLPRHLHRFVLRLLRPAEAATRRLIIIAARGIVVRLPKHRAGKSEQRAPRPDPRAMPEWARLRLQHGLPIEFPRGEPMPLWARETPEREEPVRRPRVPFFPMFDPMKRFSRGPVRPRIPEARMPRIALLNDDGWSAPLHLRRAAPPPPPSTPDDPLDAGNIHRRLEVLRRALDDLPRQAQRFARWQARREARLAAEREKAGHAGQLHLENSTSPPRSFAPPSVLPDISPSRGEISCHLDHRQLSTSLRQAPAAQLLISPLEGEMSGRTEGGAAGPDGEGLTLEELGVTPEVLALCRRAKSSGRNAQPSITAQTAKPRFHRISPMRPGRPPGWRKRQNHDVYEVLNELHGLAVWASERRDSS